MAKWISLLNHVQDVHTHEAPLFPKCLHTILKTRDKSKWLSAGLFHSTGLLIFISCDYGHYLWYDVLYNVFVLQELQRSTTWKRSWPKRLSWRILPSSVPTTRRPLWRRSIVSSCGSLLKTWSIHIWECCAGILLYCLLFENICPFFAIVFMFDFLFTVQDCTWLHCIIMRMLMEDKPPHHQGILVSNWAFQSPGRESAEPDQWRRRQHSVTIFFFPHSNT